MQQIKLTQIQMNKIEKILDKYRKGVDFSSLKNKKGKEKYKPYQNFCKNKEDAYKVANILGVNVCPYCNEQYIFTIIKENGKTITRPEFDHFISKSYKPELQLKLTNMVPSCHICNAILKGKTKLSDKTHLNPYKKDFNTIIEISIDINEDINYLDKRNFEIKFKHRNSMNKDNKLADANIEIFKLKERYQNHKDEVIKIFNLAKLYNNSKKNEIQNLICGKTLSFIPIKNILFPDKDCDINQTILGKLKRDITKKYIN